MQKTLFIHVGLHKTATTLIQRQMDAHRSALSLQSLYIPRTAAERKNPASHYNIAHQIARDRRFRRSRGTLDEMEAELAGRNENAFISSEDFESLLRRPDALGELSGLAERAGYLPVFLLSLRYQASYFESLYQELLKHGFDTEAQVAIEEVLDTGTLRFQEWIHHFDFVGIVELFREMGLTLVLRNYHQLEGGFPLADLLAGMGLDATSLTGVNRRETVNKAQAGESLVRFMTSRLGRDDRAVTDFLKSMAGALPINRPALGPKMLRRFHARFSEDNSRLREMTGVDLALGAPDDPPDGTLFLETCFSALTLESFEDAIAHPSTVHRVLTTMARKAARVLPVDDPQVGRVSAAILASWQAEQNGRMP